MNRSTPLRLFIVLCFITHAVSADIHYSGHIKGLGNIWGYPQDSLYALQEGSSTAHANLDLRINLDGKLTENPNFKWELAYQYLLAEQSQNVFSDTGIINDERRLFDLTSKLHESADSYSVHRLDRFNLSYTSERWVLRAGRQALSWGSGILFSVMDIVNPFDGRVYDQEYKVGDDILYLQYLLDNGNDLQFAEVFRRDPMTGQRGKAVNTRALKYHGFLNTLEYDLLFAEHYGEKVYALGFSGPLQEAVFHIELSQKNLAEEAYFSGLAGVNYSWVAFDKNWMGILEYFYDESGMGGEFSASDIYTRTGLLESATRGERYFFGRSYLAATTNIEQTPLLNLGATLFHNTGDQSSLLQVSATYDWQQNLQVFAALALPFGSAGTEFTGIEDDLSMPGYFLSYDYTAQARLAWYF